MRRGCLVSDRGLVTNRLFLNVHDQWLDGSHVTVTTISGSMLVVWESSWGVVVWGVIIIIVVRAEQLA